MTSHIARPARTAAAVLTALVSAACTSPHTASPATRPNTTPVLSTPMSAAASTPPAFETTVESCAHTAIGKTTAKFTVRNATAGHAYVAVFVTINGKPALQLVRADDSQPAFSPQGIGLDAGQTFTGSASLPAASGTPACTVEARAAG